jgi:hypothetical protein
MIDGMRDLQSAREGGRFGKARQKVAGPSEVRNRACHRAGERTARDDEGRRGRESKTLSERKREKDREGGSGGREREKRRVG